MILTLCANENRFVFYRFDLHLSALSKRREQEHQMSATRHPDDGRIVTRRQGSVFIIVIDRPKKLNGFSAVMLDELSAAYSAM